MEHIDVPLGRPVVVTNPLSISSSACGGERCTSDADGPGRAHGARERVIQFVLVSDVPLSPGHFPPLLTNEKRDLLGFTRGHALQAKF